MPRVGHELGRISLAAKVGWTVRWWVCFRTHRWRRRLARTWALLYSGMDGHVMEGKVKVLVEGAHAL